MPSYSSKTFDYLRDFSKINFREHPELYQVGRGEQGVLMVEPYKSEILPYWRFKNPEVAQSSAKAVYRLFLHYKRQRDFCRNGYGTQISTNGLYSIPSVCQSSDWKKYEIHHHPLGGAKAVMNAEMKARRDILPQATDWATNEKAQSAQIFYSWYLKAKEDLYYLNKKEEHMQQYG